jgi:acyl-CoA thioester hydrolase
VDYHRPLYLDDTYIVAGRTRAYRRTSWSMEYAVASGGAICATGTAVIVLMEQDFVTRKALPDAYIRAFSARDGAVHDG